MQHCGRCGEELRVSTGSYFDASIICARCDVVERAHPQFERARELETEAVKRGNYNFPGIGAPPELRSWSQKAKKYEDDLVKLQEDINAGVFP